MLNIQMTDDEFQLFRDFIHQECGLYFGSGKKSFLCSRVAKRVESVSLKSFYRYYRYLQGGGVNEKAELMRLLDHLTINETGFFRNRPQFDLLEQVILPDVIQSNRSPNGSKLRIWSAGCSTGEEPFSIAMSVLETLPNRMGWDVKIFASDLSLSVLDKASCGVYESDRLEPLDSTRLHRYFRAHPDGYEVRDEVKNYVIYDFHNLKHENGLRELDVIFCRNVLIYFDAEEQKKVLTKFIRALRLGGYLFLGHSESVLGMTDELEFVHRNKGTAYRKVQTG